MPLGNRRSPSHAARRQARRDCRPGCATTGCARWPWFQTGICDDDALRSSRQKQPQHQSSTMLASPSMTGYCQYPDHRCIAGRHDHVCRASAGCRSSSAACGMQSAGRMVRDHLPEDPAGLKGGWRQSHNNLLKDRHCSQQPWLKICQRDTFFRLWM